MDSRPLLVMVIEDDDVVADSLGELIEKTDGLALAGVFYQAEDCLAAVQSGLRPRLALVDLVLPGLSGHDLIRRLGDMSPATEAIVLSNHDDDENLFEALRAGAAGYLLKDATDAQLVRAIEDVVAGGAPMSPGLARRVLAQLRRLPKNEPPPKPEAGPLSAREREVLDLLSRGFTYETIGRGLGIALGTVQSHIRAIYRKLEVASKAEATSEAYRRGILV